MSLGDNGQLSIDKQTSFLKFLDCFLRISAVPLSVATIWLTTTNRQDNSSYGKIESQNFLGLKYMVWISGICAAYAFASAACTLLKLLVAKAWLFFVPDQIIAYLMVTSGAAVLEILHLAYKGDRGVTWSEACTSYGRFCSKVKLALILHFLALCCFLVLAVMSGYRAFSIFEPPTVSPKEVEEERA
ncbi:CASP-like protein [Psidium guajava]|nr:CASP-like protein [Psidium guajava]